MYNCPYEGHFDLLKVVFLIYILTGCRIKLKRAPIKILGSNLSDD